MKTNEEYEKEFIDTSKEKTGHTVEEWMAILKSENPLKMKQALDWLKSEKGIGHMQATFLAAIYMNNGLPVYDSKVLFESHFQDKEDKRPIYYKIESLALEEFHNMQIVPTKGYISFRNDKEFAVVKINKNQLRVGLDLADRPFDNYVQKAKSLGTMPRISHMVEVYEESEVTDKLKAKMIEANQIVNQKK